MVFYTRRIFQLVPMYIFVVLIQVVVMMSFLPDGPFSALNETFRYLVANLLFANFLQHDILRDIAIEAPGADPEIPSLWTLKIELGFYLIAPAVFAAVRRWGGGVLVAIFVASALFELVGKHLGYDQYARQLPGQMQFFAVGIAIYYYAQRIRVNTLLAMMAPIVFVALWTWCWPIPAGVRPLIVGAFVFCFALRMPVLPVGSDLSYSVYLQHGPLIQTLLFLGLLQNRTWVLCTILLAVLALSFVTERYVERPGIELGKRLSRRFTRMAARPAMAIPEPDPK